MSSTMTAVVGLVVTALLAWYAAEWVRCMAEGRAMSLVRNPLALFWLAVRRLWHNRRFVGILLLCWLASAAIHWLVIDPLVIAPVRQRFQAQTDVGLPKTEPGIREAPHTLGVLDWKFFSVGAGRFWLLRGLPQFRQVSLDGETTMGGNIGLLALGVLAAALIALWFRRPQWLPAHMHQRLAWPTYLTLGAFLAMAAHTGFGFAAALTRDPLDFSVSSASQVLYLLLPLFLIFCGAVLTVFLWHIVLQVGSGQYWNLHNAVTGAINNWLPIAWLMVLLWVPSTLLMGLTMFLFQGTISGPMVDVVSIASNIGWTITPLLRIALLFVPWIILAEGASLLPATKRNFQLIYTHWWDLVVMLPRWLLLIVPVYAIISTLSTLSTPAIFARPTIGTTVLVTSLGFAHSLVEVVALVAVVVLYQQLAKKEPRPLEDMYQTLRGLWKTLWTLWKGVEHPAG